MNLYRSLGPWVQIYGESSCVNRSYFCVQVYIFPGRHIVAQGGKKLSILKKIGLAFMMLFVLLILVPAAIVRSCNRGITPPELEVDPYQVAVWNHKTETLMPMTLGDYLVGVVAAEMPAQFNIEALKAQAIVARTYTISRLRAQANSGCEKHPQADICTDSTHCQAWISKEDARSKWPFFRQNAYWNKMLRAVSSTQGQVITYEGGLIDAVFHSTCGGRTENSEDVWSQEVPYMRGVDCSYCAHSPRMSETVRLSEAEVASRLDEPAGLRLEVVNRSMSGRIIQIDVGSKILRGLDFRTRLGLRSSRVTWLREKGSVSFTTTGYGHAVGMCQYGADGMAEEGHIASEIIHHYFTGVQIQRVQLEE